jgi:hypothetical protein
MKFKIKSVLAVLVVSVFTAQAAYALSLKLKKEKMKAEAKIEKSVANINKKCGCSPKVEIDWESFKTKGDVRISYANMSHVDGGMARVCKDFKKEVCAGVKTIKIGKAAKMGASLKGGVLDIKVTGGDRVYGDQAIQKLIEENL